MGWGARLGATWRGKASGADLGALFAATSGLTDLQQSLAARRLDAEIAQAGQTGHEWRVLLEVGPLAAPLWLAETLVGLAQAFYDEEAQPQSAHPDQPIFVSASTHDLIAALLAPVEDIIADVTAALADPNHHTGLTAPLHVGPGAEIAGYDAPRPPSAAYARGLAKGARRVHTSAASLLMEAQAAVAKSPAPDWLTTGFQRLNGSLQATGARLDMVETRMEPLVAIGRDGRARDADPVALTAICADLWTLTDTSLVAGQWISDPYLLPESPPVAAPRPATPSPKPTPTRPAPSQPAPIRASGPQASRPIAPPIAPGIPPEPLRPARPQPPQPAPDLALPQIAEGAPSSASQSGPAPSSQPAPAPAMPHPIASPAAGIAFPTVGGAPVATPATQPPTAPPLPAVAPSTPPTRPPASALPTVSDASRPAPLDTGETATDTAVRPQEPPSTPQRPPTPKNKTDDEPPTLFPKIG